MTQTNSQIREEWKDKLESLFQDMEHFITPYDEKRLINFIDKLLKSQREEMIEKIEKMAGINIENNDGTITCLILKEKVLSLIKEQ